MTTFRERLVFDGAHGEYRDGAIRYLMLRPDALMGMLHELPEPMRPQVLAALARSITRHGGRSARVYQSAGADTGVSLIATIEETAPQLGWGHWRLTQTGAGMDLVVDNSPFAAGYGKSATPVCHPIVGMLQAVGPMVLGTSVCVTEGACAAMGAPACRFTVTPA